MNNSDTLDPEQVVVTEAVEGSDIPVHLMYVETMDGLYAPIGLRKPPGDGPFPIVLLASGNGGGGMGAVRDAVRNRGYIMDELLDAGYACAWLRYRTEVELGYHNGGKLVRDQRQGQEEGREGTGHRGPPVEAASAAHELPDARCATLAARVGDMTQGRRSGSGHG